MNLRRQVSNDGYQMASTGYGNHLKKVIFSKDVSFKSYGIIYILQQRQRPYCVVTSIVASSYAKEANEMLSSTRSRSK